MPLSFTGAGDPGPLLVPRPVPHDQGVGGQIQSGRFQRFDLHQGKKTPSLDSQTEHLLLHRTDHSRMMDVSMAMRQTEKTKGGVHVNISARRR